MAKTLKEALKTIQQYKTATPHYGELLDVLEEILIVREEYRRRISDDMFHIDERLLPQKLAGGLPLVDFSRADLDLDEPKQYFIALLKVAEKRSPAEAKEIIERLGDGSLDFAEIIRSSFENPSQASYTDDYADEDDENRFFDLLSFLIEESLRPALEFLAEKYQSVIDKSQWSEGYCPICSREPKIGKLENEEGNRFLFCNQCGFEWNFMRVKCPFCGNDDQETLAFFTIEDEERYRVDVCKKCRRYIKIVDFRKSEQKPILDIEDIATLHLDILANEEGYE